MMISANAIITESLAPAVAVTGIGLIMNGLNARFSSASSRVRELNRELRTATDPARVENIKRQIPLFMRRVNIIRNATFVLFGSLGLMVFTAVSLAMTRLSFVNWEMVPAWSFLSGLILMLLAVIIEAYETRLNLYTLALDVEHSLEVSNGKLPE